MNKNTNMNNTNEMTTPAINVGAVLDENGIPSPNPKYMDEAFLKRVFADPRVVTLEDLPWYDKDKHKLPNALAANLERIKSK